MKNVVLISILTLLAHWTLPAQLTVWPGDANNNGVANHIDLLYVGLSHGSMGPARNSPSNNWQPFAASTWQQQTPGGIDLAYADCNGDGFVDTSDTTAIGQNFLLNTGTVFPDTFSPTGANAPILKLDFQQDSLVFTNDTTIMVNIELGDSINMMDSIYGLAFTVVFDSNIVDSVIFNLQGGFLAAGGSLLTMGRIRGNRVHLALARTGQVSTAGFGTIGSIGIVMDDNLRTAQNFSLAMEIVDIVAMGVMEQLLPVQPQSDTLRVEAVTVGREAPRSPLVVYPQPAGNWLALESPVALESVVLYDLHGRRVRQVPVDGHRSLRIDLAGLPAGAYFLQARAKERCSGGASSDNPEPFPGLNFERSHKPHFAS